MSPKPSMGHLISIFCPCQNEGIAFLFLSYWALSNYPIELYSNKINLIPILNSLEKEKRGEWPKFLRDKNIRSFSKGTRRSI